jgi:ABC-2 type transport system permease protein
MIEKWHRIRALLIKELLAVWRDKKSRIVLIIPPIVQLCIFTFAATLDVQNVSIGILNRDNGGESFELVQRFMGAPTFKTITHLQSIEEIAPYINNQNGVMVVSIDEQFSRLLNRREPASVQIILDGRKSNSTQIVAGYATTIIQQFNDDFSAQHKIPTQATHVNPYYWYNPNLYYYWYNVPSLTGVITMLVGLIVTALSVAREREVGTFDQLLVSPITPTEILIGKTIPGIIIGMMEGTIILAVGVLLFQVPFTGSLLLLYLSMFLFVSSIVGFGLLISSLSSTQQQAILGTFVFMSPALLLSGFATPIENMPHWLQLVTYLNPLRYFLIISKGIFLKEMPFHIVVTNLWQMALIALIALPIAGWFFRRRLD